MSDQAWTLVLVSIGGLGGIGAAAVIVWLIGRRL